MRPRDVLATAEAPVHWLLTLDWAGGVRVAETDLDVEVTDGDALHFEGWLAADIETEEAVQFGGGTAGQVSVAITTFLTAPGAPSVAQLVAEGRALAGARAELARWVEGTPWEERRVVVVGRVSAPEWGDDADPVAFSIETRLTEEAGLTHAPSWRVDGRTWAHADTLLVEHLGVPYPIVIGRPGRITANAGALPTLPSFATVTTSSWITGSKAVWVDRRDTDDGGYTTECRCVVSYGHVSATRVYMTTEAYPAGYRFHVRTGFDALGQPISFVPWFTVSTPAGAPDDDLDTVTYNYSYFSTDTDGESAHSLGYNFLDASFNANGSTEQNQLFVGWLDPETDGGGITVDGQEIRAAGDVLAFVLGFSGATIDRGRVNAAAPLLAPFLLDCAIEARVKPWEWVTSEALPILPVSVDTGPSGVFWHVWRSDLTAADAALVLDVDADPSIVRVSPLVEDDSQVVNRFTLSFAASRQSGSYVAQATLGAADDLVDDDDTIREHPACTLSRARYGVRERSIESAIVYADTTAWAALEAQAALWALPWTTVTYDVPEAPYIRAGRMVAVSVTDSAVALDDRPGIIIGVRTPGDGRLLLTVALRPLLRKATR